MGPRTVAHSTFVLERELAASRERVFAAFADAGKKRRWFVEGPGHEVESHTMDFRVGGEETSTVRFKEGTPVAGMGCLNELRYLEIQDNATIVMSAAMTVGGRRISATLVTVELLESGTGTRLILTHQGAFFAFSDGPERRQKGWEVLMDRLAAELGG